MNNSERLNPLNFKLSLSCRDQIEFQSLSLNELVPENHIVRTLWDFVLSMDLTVCLKHIMTVKGKAGRKAIDPKILLTLWLYTIIDGNISARKLEELCKYHTIYKWICGGVSVNRTNLAEFRSDNPDKFDTLLTSCLAVMVKNGLISDTDFAQDGTRIKANASNNSFLRENSLKNLENEITDYIKKLKEEEKTVTNSYEKKKLVKEQSKANERKRLVALAITNLNEAQTEKQTNSRKSQEKIEKDLPNMRASIVEPHVRKMKMGDSGFRLAYNIQFATGINSRVIYGVDVVNTMDPGTAPNLMTQVWNRLKNLNLEEFKNWVADAAYSGSNDIKAVAKLFPNCFYFAPPKNNINVDPKIHRRTDSEEIKNWKDSIGTKKANELYKLRCSTAEFSNMQIKNHGLVEFPVRTLEKVKGMTLLHVISANFMRSVDLTKKLKDVLL